MKPHPKPVPSTVTADPVAQGQASRSKQESSARIEDPKLHDQPEQRPKSMLVRELWKISKDLPNTVPLAAPNDKLARFANAAAYDNPSLASDDLWEEVLNPFLKDVLGWGVSADLDQDLRRGKLGFDAVVGFVTYFVEDRGVDEVLFEGKLAHLVGCAKKITLVLFKRNQIMTYLTEICRMASSEPKITTAPARIISIDADFPSDDEIIEIVSSEVQQREINKSPGTSGLRNGDICVRRSDKQRWRD